MVRILHKTKKSESKEEVAQQGVVTESEVDKEKDTTTEETQNGDDFGSIGQIDYGSDVVANAAEPENFLKTYFSYNGDNPKESVERAEPYVTESLYVKIDESNFQSGSSDYYREFKKLKEVKSGKKPSPNDLIPLIYYVDGVKTSADKQNEKYTNDLFVLSVKKENGSYKVDSFKINLPKN